MVSDQRYSGIDCFFAVVFREGWGCGGEWSCVEYGGGGGEDIFGER